MPFLSRRLAGTISLFCLVTLAVGGLLFSRSFLLTQITLSSKSSPDREQYVFASRGQSRNSQQHHNVSGGSSRILRRNDPYEDSGHIPLEKEGKGGTRALASGEHLARQATTVKESSSPRQAKLAFLVLSDGNDIDRMREMLLAIYHPDNIYLVHVDAKTPPAKVHDFQKLVREVFPGRNGRQPNGRLLEPAGIVSWGGFSLTLACIFGISVALSWDSNWDYFINVSTADYPVLTQVEMRKVLGEYAGSGVSFMDGALMRGFEKRWRGYVDDEGLYRHSELHSKEAMALLRDVYQPFPQLFSLYKGEFWTTLHRSYCQYVVKSPDNVARGLSAYFTGFRISDESYFQTVACHPEGREFPVHGDSLRFNNWDEHHTDADGRRVDKNGNILLHPQLIQGKNVDRILKSGAMFARKFDHDVRKSAVPYSLIIADLSDEARSEARIQAVRDRIGRTPSSMVGRDRFCNTQEAVRLRRTLAEMEALEAREGGSAEGKRR